MKTEKTYYISSQDGNDRNDGLSAMTAFRTLARIQQMAIRAGEKICLKRGSVFREEALHLSVQGTKENPIIVEAYGEGEPPRIEAEGCGLWYQNYGNNIDSDTHVYRGYVSSAILLFDCEYLIIRDLEITNAPRLRGEYYSQGDKMNRTGVAVVAQNRGTLHGIELANLYIHGIRGNVYDKHMCNGGIYCIAQTPEKEETGIARYDGMHIHHCRVEDCSRWGIAVGYTYTFAHFAGKELDSEIVKKYGHTDVVIEENELREIGGDGITPMYCYRPLVQYNRAEKMAREINTKFYMEEGVRGGKVAAAIWPWKCKNALFQYNEAYLTCANQDGQAWDADSGDGCVYRYNYSYGNTGGCVMFCEAESVNNIFCYNISVGDQDGILNPAKNPDAHIFHNSFFLTDETPFIRNNMSGGSFLAEHNVVCSLKEGYRGYWHHQTTGAVYKDNLYYGVEDVPEGEDKSKVLRSPEHLEGFWPTSIEESKGVKRIFELMREQMEVAVAGDGKPYGAYMEGE